METITYDFDTKEVEWNPSYRQSYLNKIGWNDELLARISNMLITKDEFGNEIFRQEVFNPVTDTIEKLGMLYLGRDMIAQDIRRFTDLGQTLVQFHLYHWFYDSVACLDSLACLLNAHLKLDLDTRQIRLDKMFLKILKKSGSELAKTIEEDLVWIKELGDTRNSIIHREGRVVTGGGPEPCLMMDFQRMFTPTFDLNRVRIPNILDDYLKKVDALCLRVISRMDRD